VRAQSESLAREVVTSSALASPSVDEIKLANLAGFIGGKKATLVSVDFSVDEDSVKLIGVDELCLGVRRLKKISGASHRGSLTFFNNFAVRSSSAKN
jgi:hypothetical protein